MSAAAAALEYEIRGLSRDRFQIINADIVYQKAGAAIREWTHGTSAEIGRVGPYTKTAGELFAGYIDTPHQVAEAGGSDTSATGDTSATPPPTAGIQMEDMLLKNVAVAGATGRTDWGRPVYSSTDNLKTDLTLTRPAAPAEAVGIVWKGIGTNLADVLLFGLRTRLAMQRPGQTEKLHLATLNFAAATDGNIAAGIIIPFKCRVLSLHGLVVTPNVGSGGTTVLNLEKDTANLTGGTLTWSTAVMTASGVVHDFSALTQNANTIWREGSVIDIEGSSTGGTTTSGLLEVFAKVERLAGL